MELLQPVTGLGFSGGESRKKRESRGRDLPGGADYSEVIIVEDTQPSQILEKDSLELLKTKDLRAW